MNTLFLKILSVLIFSICFIYLIYNNKKKKEIIINTLNQKMVVFNILLIIIFYIIINYVINNKELNLINIDEKEHKKLISASNQALFGFVIAIFAYIGVIIPPFWFIFLGSAVFSLKT